MNRMECKVFGKVQGVFFRHNTLETSKNFKVKGFVKNLPSGEVLIVAEGEKEELEKFLEAIKNFTFTSIEKIEVEWKKAKNEFREFKIEY
jgi:acylphosphatase